MLRVLLIAVPALLVVTLLLWLLRPRHAQLPPCVVLLGPEGVGKSHVATSWLLKQMVLRFGLSNYAVNGARPLQRFTDLLHEMCVGSAVVLDEAQAIFPAREWLKEDPIESRLIEHLRHLGISLMLCVHAAADLSVHLRRRVNLWITVERIGPDPTLLLVQGKEPTKAQRPRRFRLRAYKPGKEPDYLPALTKPSMLWTQVIDFDLKVAMQYDTTERIWTDSEQHEIERRLAGAEQRLSVPPWHVEGGIRQGAVLRLQRARDLRSQPAQPPASAPATPAAPESDRVHELLSALTHDDLAVLEAALGQLDDGDQAGELDPAAPE